MQADILVTGNREMLLLDVTPLSLGIETMGGVTSKIIMRNSTIPATGSEMFTTAVDNQTAVDIHVLQGERELVADNRSLARFKLRGIPPMPAGLPRVQVQFQIDANGILSVTASELRTEIEQTVEVKPSYGLTDEQVEQMLMDSFENAEADFAARLLIEARNEAENVIHATEKSLRATDIDQIESEELAAGERKKIESVLAGLKMVLNSTDRETIQKWTQALNDTTRHLAEVMMNRSVKAALAGKNNDSSSADVDYENYAQSDVHHRRRGNRHRVRTRQGAVLEPRQAGVVSRPRQELPRAARARLRRQLRLHDLPRDHQGRRAAPQRDAGRRGRSPRHRVGPDRALAPRLPGGDQRRRRLRAADVYPQLRAGRRRHSARQVRQEGQGRRR